MLFYSHRMIRMDVVNCLSYLFFMKVCFFRSEVYITGQGTQVKNVCKY